jgi:hypothetical protein
MGPQGEQGLVEDGGRGRVEASTGLGRGVHADLVISAVRAPISGRRVSSRPMRNRESALLDKRSEVEELRVFEAGVADGRGRLVGEPAQRGQHGGGDRGQGALVGGVDRADLGDQGPGVRGVLEAGLDLVGGRGVGGRDPVEDGAHGGAGQRCGVHEDGEQAAGLGVPAFALAGARHGRDEVAGAALRRPVVVAAGEQGPPHGRGAPSKPRSG